MYNEMISSMGVQEDMPCDPDSEQALLASVLIEPEDISLLMEKIPSGDYFYVPVNRDIYNAMSELFMLNITLNYKTLLAKLKETTNYPHEDMRAYLVGIMDEVPVISAIDDYIAMVREKYFVRKLITTAREIIDYTFKNSNGNANRLIDAAEKMIFDIRDTRSSGGLEQLKYAIFETFDRLDILNSPESDSVQALSTGIGSLDSTITGLNKSDLIILAARPGMGKTSFALNIASYVSMKCKKKVAFFSLEMSREQLAARLLSTEGLIPSTKLRTGKLSNEEWQRLIEAADVLSKAELYIDYSSNITVPEIKAKLKKQKGFDLVIIDYLQLMKPARANNNHVQEVSEITRDLKILAKEMNVPVITLSQLSRASEQRAEHKPQLSDLRDSGSIEQDADIVLFLYREDYYKDKSNQSPNDVSNHGECIVAKNRHGETRSVPLHWQGEFMRFTSEVNDVR